MIDTHTELEEIETGSREPLALSHSTAWRGDQGVRRFLDGILLAALSRGASEITIEPIDGEVLVRYTIAGERVPACASLPAGAAANLATIVKEYAHLDICDREHSQAGRVRLRAETCPGIVHDVRMQIDVCPTEFGESATLRLRDAAACNPRSASRSSDRSDAIQPCESACREHDRTVEFVCMLAGTRFADARHRLFHPRPPGMDFATWAG
jgi:type II secretory ATPase GspE/PulE/Tfp pilus assembly ATPase PilB-like protein